MYQILCIVSCYIVSSFLLSVIEKLVFKTFKINLKNYSSKMQSSFFLFLLFSHITIIISFIYALHQPDFINFCIKHHEFCLSWVLHEEIIKFEVTDTVFALLITLFLTFRLFKTFKNDSIVPALISPFIYKEKLKIFLNDEEIIKLQIHDTDEIYAYCKGIIKPKIYLSKGLINFLSPEKLHIVLLHEKAHIKRLDIFYIFMFKLISIFEIYPSQINYYFKQWKKEKEKACDDEVIKTYSPLLVAQTIVEIALKSQIKQNNLGLNFAENQIVERVERLTDYNNNQKYNNYILGVLWLLLITIVFLLLNVSFIHCMIDQLVLYFFNFFSFN